MKKSIILNDSQVNRLQQTGTVLVVDMVKPQPEDCSHIHLDFTEAEWRNEPMQLAESISDKGFYYCKLCGNGVTPKHGYKGIPAPYQPGSTLYVREAWLDYIAGGAEVDSYIEYYYKADTLKGLFCSPATMPKSAARLFPVVDKVECVRCKDVDALQRNNIGLLTTSSDSAIIEKLRHIMSFRDFITYRFGQSFWDENGWIFLTKLKLTK